MTIAKRLTVLLGVPLIALMGLGIFTRLQLSMKSLPGVAIFKDVAELDRYLAARQRSHEEPY